MPLGLKKNIYNASHFGRGQQKFEGIKKFIILFIYLMKSIPNLQTERNAEGLNF